MKKIIIALLIALAIIAGGVVGWLAGVNGWIDSVSNPLGSIVTGQEYYATSTVHTAVISNRLIKGGYGSVAQITVTGAGTSGYMLLDATSTSFSHSNGKVATSTALIATVPPSLAAGTYTFDATYTRGLYIYFTSVGTAPTSTITYR